MSLSPQQVTELRESWAALAADPETLTRTFYAELFRLAPQVAPMFATSDMAWQRSKLSAALALVVRHAGDIGTLGPALHDLGCRHAGFGVTEAHYRAVGRALLHALAVCLGPSFRPETRTAWAAAFGVVSAAMQAGSGPLRQSA